MPQPEDSGQFKFSHRENYRFSSVELFSSVIVFLRSLVSPVAIFNGDAFLAAIVMELNFLF